MKNFVFDLYGTLADIRTDETSARFRKKTDALMLRKFGIAHFCNRLQAATPSASAEDNEPDFFPAFCSIFGNDAAAQAAALYRKRSRAFLRVYRGVRPLRTPLTARARAARRKALSAFQRPGVLYQKRAGYAAPDALLRRHRALFRIRKKEALCDLLYISNAAI